MKPKKPTAAPRKPQGAAFLSQSAWTEIGNALQLTPTELRVVRHVFDNCTERAMAHQMAVTEHTVHTHMNRLFKKLGVTTRTELVLRVMEQLVDLTVSASGSLPPICRHYHLQGCPANHAGKSTPDLSAKQPTGGSGNVCDDVSASQKANPR